MTLMEPMSPVITLMPDQVVDPSAFDLLASGYDDGWCLRIEDNPTLPAIRRAPEPGVLTFTSELITVEAGRRVRSVTVVRDEIDYWTLHCDFKVFPQDTLTVTIRRGR